MASEVQIVNLALAHLGDSADVSSIDPPEGSPQAHHCARFYPIARDSLLEMHDWAFASGRVALGAPLAADPGQWSYAYAMPADALRILSVLPATAGNDYADSYPQVDYFNYPQLQGQYTMTTAAQFSVETDAEGRSIIVTNQPDAIVRYTKRIIDTGRFSPLFTDTLARYLASYLAGPVLKGDSGINQAKGQLAIAMNMMARAALSSANQQQQHLAHTAPWLAVR